MFKKGFKDEICKFKVEGLEREKRERERREEREIIEERERLRLREIIGERERRRERKRREERERLREIGREEGERLREVEREENEVEREERKERKKRVEKTIENLSKNEFIIPKKYKKYKKSIAEYIRILFKEYKWLRTYYFKFLITGNFKKFEEIEKIKLNRNGIVLCYNGENKIVCIYFFYLDDKYFYKLKKYYQIQVQNNLDIIYDIVDDIDDVDDANINENINIDYLISFDEILLDKEYLDGRRREIKIIEKRI